jgi:hypothetical protein
MTVKGSLRKEALRRYIYEGNHDLEKPVDERIKKLLPFEEIERALGIAELLGFTSSYIEAFIEDHPSVDSGIASISKRMNSLSRRLSRAFCQETLAPLANENPDDAEELERWTYIAMNLLRTNAGIEPPDGAPKWCMIVRDSGG